MRLVLRCGGALLAAIALAAAATAAGCGDITVPSSTDDGGDDGAANDDGNAPGEDGGNGDAAPVDCTADGESSHPTHVQCTGLYTDFANRVISPDAQPYDPGLHMWADGAETRRWIYLPPGQKIDTTDLNEWKFPTGTKLWQEFRLLGKRVETRFLWKIAPQTWFRTTYQWSDDESDAVELVTGQINVRGIGYEIPSTDVCQTCHGGRLDLVLGFELVSLSSPTATGLTIDQLTQKGLLTKAPTAKPVIPGDQLTSGSLSFLHSNCGTSCHANTPSASASASGLFTRLEVDATGALPVDWRQTPTYKTAFNVVSTFTPIGQPAGSFYRIKPSDASKSAIPYRAGRRDGVVQMPPIASHLVDFTDVKTVQDWINAMPAVPIADAGAD